MANRNFLVGIFIVVGMTLFTVGIFLVGDRHEAFARHVEFYTEFTNLDGLTKGSKVKVAGMDAGQIVEVGVPNSPSSPFRVKFQINQGSPRVGAYRFCRHDRHRGSGWRNLSVSSFRKPKGTCRSLPGPPSEPGAD